ENVDLKGNHFNVFARQSFEAAFDGYAVILVDTPRTEAEIRSKADEAAMGIRPYMRLYTAASVINHRYTVNRRNETVLELLVLHEPQEVVDPENEFGTKTVDYYRVYRLRDEVVSWELWRKDKQGGMLESTFVQEGGGILSNRSAIPVAIIGELTDEPKLLVESRLEIKAYQKESS